MASFKLVFSNPKSGKSSQREVKDKEAVSLIGLKIKDAVKGESIGLAGYEFQITGGSDYCGFPMRADVPGQGRKKIFATKSIGIREAEHGIRRRKTVCGNTIHSKIHQINLMVTKEGKENIFPEKAEKKEEKKA